MRRPQLSILIPSIPERFDKVTKLYSSLVEMKEDREIEIIILTDNRQMSIGMKQNYLKFMGGGKYFMFLHDDDHLVSLKEVYDATFLNVDVIDFKAICYNNDGSTYTVTQRLGNEVEHNTVEGRYMDCNRPPFPNCAWMSDKFREIMFPDISYSEDWEWVKQCLSIAKTEHFIDKIVFSYNFSPTETAASTESNEFWTNPN